MISSIWNRQSPRRQSGSAMVEFSILMLAFVPCMLYGFFLSDAAYHQLEVQETVVSTMWDFSQRNAQPEDQYTGSTSMASAIAAVQAANRGEYVDHTSAFDDTSTMTETNEAVFNTFAAKAAWTGTSGVAYDALSGAGGTQVTCSDQGSPDLAWTDFGLSQSAVGGLMNQLNPLHQFGADTTYNIAGSVNCWAGAVVYNFLVPQQFMQDFSAVNLTNQTNHQAGDTVHTINGSGTNVFLRDRAQIAFGTWAIDDGETQLGVSADNDIQFGQSNKDKNPFQDRVSKVYAGETAPAISFVIVQGRALAFSAAASNVMVASEFMADSALLQVAAGNYTMGDTMLNLPGGVNIDPGVDPLMTFLVARYNAGTGNAAGNDPTIGHHPVNHCAWPSNNTIMYLADFMTCEINGDNNYESTPTQGAFQNNTKFVDAFNARGSSYMGVVGETSWTP